MDDQPYTPKLLPAGFVPFRELLCPACGFPRPLDAFYERPDRPLFRRSRWSALCKVHECTRIRQKRANGRGAGQRKAQRLAAKARAADAAKDGPNVLAYRNGRGHVIVLRPEWQARYAAKQAQERNRANRLREERALMRYWREVNGIRTKSFGDRARERRLREIRDAALRDASAPVPSHDPYADPVRQAESAIWLDDTLSPAETFARLRALRSGAD